MQITVKGSNNSIFQVETHPDDSCLEVRKKILRAILLQSNAQLDSTQKIDATASIYKLLYRGRHFPVSDENFLSLFSLSEDNTSITLNVLIGGCTGLRLIENATIIDEQQSIRP